MKILIMCGGMGKRLGTLTEKIPKPLIKVNNKVILNVKIEQYLQELEEIRDKINKETTPLKQLYMRDINLSKAMSKMAALRQKSEDINAINVSYAHHERFLNFVSKGKKKPALAELMDNTSLQNEIDNPYNKNVDLIMSQIEGMTKDGEAPMSVLKEALNLDN